MKVLIFCRNFTKTFALPKEVTNAVISLSFQFQFQLDAVHLCCFRSSCSYNLSVCLDIVLVLVKLFVCLFLVSFSSKLSENYPTRWNSLFLVVMSFVRNKGDLTTVLQELEQENQNVAQQKRQSFIKTLLKPFARQRNVTSFKSSVCVVLVLFLVPSC